MECDFDIALMSGTSVIDHDAKKKECELTLQAKGLNISLVLFLLKICANFS